MKITKISASFSCKKQIRQYEPIDVFMSVEAELDLEVGGQDEIKSLMTLHEAQEKIFLIAKAGVEEQIEKITHPVTQQNLYE